MRPIQVIALISIAAIFGSVLSAASLTALGEATVGRHVENELLEYDRENLEKMAYACEKYEREVKKLGNIKGGLVDYVWRLNAEDIVKIITNYTEKFPELDSIETLTKKAGITTKTKSQLYSEYLSHLSLEQVKNMALKAEEYHRKKEGKENFLGGLHDYIDVLQQEDIIKIISGYVKKHPELSQNRLLEIYASGWYMSPEEIRENIEIHKVSRTDMIYWTIACDEYDRARSPRLGGIHEFAFRLTRSQLINSLVSCLTEYPELTVFGKIQNVAGELKERSPGLFGGFMDYAGYLSKDELVAIAIAAEKYVRENKGESYIGGIHDYVHTLEREDIVRIIRDFVRNYPELNEEGKLEELAGVEKQGLYGYISHLDKSGLITLALGIDRDLKKDRPDIIGGVHDYVYRMEDEEIRDWIKERLDANPHLLNKQKLEGLMKSVDGGRFLS